MSNGKRIVLVGNAASKAEKDAVGSLIAAAPELAEALQSLLDAQNDAPLETNRHTWEAACQEAIAALKKANWT